VVYVLLRHTRLQNHPNLHLYETHSQMRDEIQYLREENRRKDEIIMQQAMTMRALTSPPEPSESPETPSEDVGRVDKGRAGGRGPPSG
jgi:hypothetical protein